MEMDVERLLVSTTCEERCATITSHLFEDMMHTLAWHVDARRPPQLCCRSLTLPLLISAIGPPLNGRLAAKVVRNLSARRPVLELPDRRHADPFNNYRTAPGCLRLVPLCWHQA